MADDLRDKVAEALYRNALDRAGARPGFRLPDRHEQIVREHANIRADAVMGVLEDDAVERLADRLLEHTRMRALTIRDGKAELDIQPARELAAIWVGVARTLLGDAENYRETPVEYEVGLAGERERFALIVQRVGKLTPHQARTQAEAELERLREDLAERLVWLPGRPWDELLDKVERQRCAMVDAQNLVLERARQRAEAEAERDELTAAVEQHESLLSSIALYIDWQHVTRELTTPEKELFADALEREAIRVHGPDGDDPDPEMARLPSYAPRWWRPDASIPTEEGV